jgi:transcription antitermination factor NusG
MKIVHNAVFPGYLFCRFDMNLKLPVISSHAVEYVVSLNGLPMAIPDVQIEHIRRAVEAGALPAPYVQVGERVRVEFGPLAGLEGILVRRESRGRLVVSVDLLQRSVSLEIDEDHVGSCVHG